MIDFTWFRLVIRAIGVLLVGLAMPSAVNHLASLIQLLAASSSMEISHYLFAMIAEFAGVVLMLGFGLYLLIGGGALIRYCTRDVTGLCASCGYDVRNLDADRCPECGAPIPRRRAQGPAAPEPPRNPQSS